MPADDRFMNAMQRLTAAIEALTTLVRAVKDELEWLNNRGPVYAPVNGAEDEALCDPANAPF